MAVIETLTGIIGTLGSFFGKKDVDIGKQYSEDFQNNRKMWEAEFNNIVLNSSISDERKSQVIEAWNSQVVPKLQQNPYIFDKGPVEGRYPRGNVDLASFTQQLIDSTQEAEPSEKESLSANSSLISTLAQIEFLQKIQEVSNKVDSINPQVTKTNISPMMIIGGIAVVIAVIYFMRKGK